jgi:hypothetical protein
VREQTCFFWSTAIFVAENQPVHSVPPRSPHCTRLRSRQSSESPTMSAEEFTNKSFTNLSRLFSLYSFTPLPLDVEDLEERNNNVKSSGACCAGGSLKVDVTFPSSREVREGDLMTLAVSVMHGKRDVSVVSVVGSTAVVHRPEVTSMMSNVIFSAGQAARGRPIVTAYNSALWRKEIDLLQDFGCLNNELINYYLNMVVERSAKRNEWPSVYAFSSFFFGKLQSHGYRGVKRWTNRVDNFSYELVFVPVHLGEHWCLVLIDFEQKKVCYYDSLGAANLDCLSRNCLYLEAEHVEKKRVRYDISTFSKVSLFIGIFFCCLLTVSQFFL